jgi:hypothetical protein
MRLFWQKLQSRVLKGRVSLSLASALSRLSGTSLGFAENGSPDIVGLHVEGRVVGTIIGGFLGHIVFIVIALYLHVEVGDHDLAGVSPSKK